MAFFRKPSAAARFLVVGLANPGPKYERTRHNAGQMVVDVVARRHGFAKARRGYEGRLATGVIAGREVALLVPTTFMNRSGRSVAAALRGLGLGPDQLLIVHDHIDLAFGRLRAAESGGSGGHNGLKSVSGLVGNEYARLRVGVGRPASTDPDVVADYVLAQFAESRDEVETLIDRAADAIEVWVRDGVEAMMQTVNTTP